MRSKKILIQSSDQSSEHILVVKEHKFPWWVLLLLLPLLLLIPIKRDVKIELQTQEGVSVDGALTDFSCPQHWPYNDSDPLRLSERTDSIGRVVFRDIKLPLYAVWFIKDTASVNSENDCHALSGYSDILKNYPEDRYLALKMQEKTATLPFTVADKETREPLPDAYVAITIKGEETHTEPLRVHHGRTSLHGRRPGQAQILR